MKRFLIITVVFALCASFLGGCSDKDGGSATEEATECIDTN